LRLEIDKFEFLFLQLFFRILDLSIDTLRLALDEIQSCLYVRAGFVLILGHKDRPNELEYCIIWGEVLKLLFHHLIFRKLRVESCLLVDEEGEVPL